MASLAAQKNTRRTRTELWIKGSLRDDGISRSIVREAFRGVPSDEANRPLSSCELGCCWGDAREAPS